MTDPELAARFIDRLYGRQRVALLKAGRSGYLTVVGQGRQRLIAHLDITEPTWLDQIRETVIDVTAGDTAAMGADLYFGNALRRKDLGPYGQGKQQPQQLMSLGHLFAEADYAADAAHKAGDLASREALLGSLDRFSPRPDIVISSGNGFHCYWLLEDPLWLNEANFNQVKKLSLDWQHKFQAHFRAEGIGGIDAIMNLDRILRIPGSVNHKGGQKRPVEALWGLS